MSGGNANKKAVSFTMGRPFALDFRGLLVQGRKHLAVGFYHAVGVGLGNGRRNKECFELAGS